MEDTTCASLLLGIDLGTTAVKVTLLDPVSRKVLLSNKSDTNAKIAAEQNPNYAEQDVGLILSALTRILSDFPKTLLSRVGKVGVCGQMHGCMFWSSEHKCTYCIATDIGPNCTSNLITWEDQRCSQDFLSALPRVSGNCLPLCTGFGCASIFWLLHNDSRLLHRYNCAGTVQDFLVTKLCNLDKPVMSSHNAVSWGYYDTMRCMWERELLKSAGFPVHLLPDVCAAGTIAGVLNRDYYGIPAGAKVGLALGDLQCSVLASTDIDSHAVLNIGTSSQLAVLVPSKELSNFNTNSSVSTIQVWPYFKGEVVAVVASLTGGNAFTAFVETLESWMNELGVSTVPCKLELYNKLLECASSRVNTTLNIRPTLWGERHDTALMGEVSHVKDSNISLGDITVSLCQGIIQNLHSMFPKDTLVSCGVKQIIGTGSALTQNAIMQQEAERVWGLPLVTREIADASLGAALALV